MSRWIEIGSAEHTYAENKDKIQAYLTWIGKDLRSIKVEEAFVRYPESKWNTSHTRWAINVISKQSHSGLDILRETYSKKSGIEWKMATLDSIFQTLGWCLEMYQNGRILMCGNSIKTISPRTPVYTSIAKNN